MEGPPAEPPCALSPEQVREELLELTRLAGLDLREDVFDVLLELTRLDVVPTAVSQARERARGAT